MYFFWIFTKFSYPDDQNHELKCKHMGMCNKMCSCQMIRYIFLTLVKISYTVQLNNNVIITSLLSI